MDEYEKLHKQLTKLYEQRREVGIELGEANRVPQYSEGYSGAKIHNLTAQFEELSEKINELEAKRTEATPAHMMSANKSN